MIPHYKPNTKFGFITGLEGNQSIRNSNNNPILSNPNSQIRDSLKRSIRIEQKYQKEQREQILKEAECPIYMVLYNRGLKQPISLDCGHSLCSHCIKDDSLKVGLRIQCPVCKKRNKYNPNNSSKNVTILNLMDRFENLKGSQEKTERLKKRIAAPNPLDLTIQLKAEEDKCTLSEQEMIKMRDGVFKIIGLEIARQRDLKAQANDARQLVDENLKEMKKKPAKQFDYLDIINNQDKIHELAPLGILHVEMVLKRIQAFNKGTEDGLDRLQDYVTEKRRQLNEPVKLRRRKRQMD